MSKKKYTINDIFNEFFKRGYKLLSTKYINSNSKMEYICTKHEDKGVQKITLDNLLHNHGCKFCGRERTTNSLRHDATLVKENFKSINCLLLDTYENQYKEIRFICLKHEDKGIQYTTYKQYLKNRNNVVCKYCLKNQPVFHNKLDIEYVRQEFKKVGFTLVETEYKNSKTPLKYVCDKHPYVIQTVKWNPFKSQGKECPFCKKEGLTKKQINKYKYLKEKFNEKNLTLLDKVFINTSTPMLFICNKHADKGIQKVKSCSFEYGDGCKYCTIEKISGSNSNKWKGGITELNDFLRGKLDDWKFESLKYYNYKCVITNISNHNLVIHHLYSFSYIAQETLESLNLPIYINISEYSDDELKLITNKCIELHYKYGYGVPLTKEIHKEFHVIYGYGNNTPEQFEEFKQNKLIEYQLMELGDSA